MKSTDDTDDGYDECQTSDESSDIESNNVVSFLVLEEVKELSFGYDKNRILDLEKVLVHDGNIGDDLVLDDRTD